MTRPLKLDTPELDHPRPAHPELVPLRCRMLGHKPDQSLSAPVPCTRPGCPGNGHPWSFPHASAAPDGGLRVEYSCSVDGCLTFKMVHVEPGTPRPVGWRAK